MATKPDESDPEWRDWFRKKMDEGYPEEDAFYARLGRRSGPGDGLEKGNPEAPVSQTGMHRRQGVNT
ncbi:hypothetical protein [Sulfitobacter sp. 1A16808]|uniref:hypothetical protein n=1 Tax=Sulfitobacter sp. 1A16808 TaxID=3368572 RepID=UPI00374796E2